MTGEGLCPATTACCAKSSFAYSPQISAISSYAAAESEASACSVSPFCKSEYVLYGVAVAVTGTQTINSSSAAATIFLSVRVPPLCLKDRPCVQFQSRASSVDFSTLLCGIVPLVPLVKTPIVLVTFNACLTAIISSLQDSNLRQHIYETCILPTKLREQMPIVLCAARSAERHYLSCRITYMPRHRQAVKENSSFIARVRNCVRPIQSILQNRCARPFQLVNAFRKPWDLRRTADLWIPASHSVVGAMQSTPLSLAD